MENHWENPDLVRRLRYSINFAKKTIKLLAKDGFSHPDDKEKNVKPGKIIGETAILLLFAASPECQDELQPDIDELAVLLIPFARSEKNLVDICLYPSLALDIAHAHICLSKIGYPDLQFDNLLIAACNAHAHFGHERTPYRIIEREWMRKLWKNVNRSIDSIIPYTLLTHPIDLLHGTRDDMYAFTHALIYSAGIDQGFEALQRQKEEILDEADAMLAKCLDEQDYDLTAELLLSWPLTGSEWSPTSVFALRVLEQLENKVGFLPSPSIHTEIPKGIRESERISYLYGTTYHTIYVMGLLCSTILKYQWNPSRVSCQKKSEKGIAKKVLSLLAEKSYTPFWLSVYNGMSECEQDSIAVCVFNISLIRSISKMDYEHVFQILKFGAEISLINTAIARQTAELLDRVEKMSTFLKIKNGFFVA
jgi:hypothetical protein